MIAKKQRKPGITLAYIPQQLLLAVPISNAGISMMWMPMILLAHQFFTIALVSFLVFC
jgi:type IV secretory pathway VirB3-like protein